ncbi:MAG TPA: TonB-dependent receptor [Candidatus Saccharimonadales bacterium]|nr:TonB-dependent receptor [Candidatus Saccharimonadales bacterium]
MKRSLRINARVRKKRLRKVHASWKQVASFVAGCSFLLPAAHGAELAAVAPAKDKINVMDMDLEALMKIEVTSVSKRPEKLSDAAAAIYVITNEDIRRAGATSIPEALRLAPGLEVARQDSHTWAISSRGFNDEFANQLLVLIDGRSVYTPLFAGVYWDVQDLPLEDISQIEVIRGPGAALWGANAVNGVINITTKKAKDTQGLLVTAGGGNEERGFGTVRYGGKLGEHAFYRVYAKYLNRDDSALPGGDDANDRWSMWRGGFRLDWEPIEKNLFTLQGDVYKGDLNQTVTVPSLTAPYSESLTDKVKVAGGNLLGRWNHKFAENSELALKLYYDRTERDRVVFDERRDTFDFDLQHRFQLGDRNDIVVGVGYNLTADKLNNTFAVAFNPTRRTSSLYSGFVQDEIDILRDRLRLTLGTKVEHNDYTGWEVQPNARLSLNITKKQTAWFAASRAISTPSRAEDDIRINRLVYPPGVFGPDPALVSQFGSRAMDSKELIAFELGYRIQPHERVTLDLATFYNIYDRQRSLEPGLPQPEDGHLLIPFTIGNMINGEVYGAELASSFQPASWWRLRVNYTIWSLQLHKKPGSNDPLLEGAENDSPNHQIGVRSLMDLGNNVELDLGFRYVDSLPNRGVPSYEAFDARVGWRPSPHWEFSVAAQNAFGRHKEFAPSYIQTQTTEVETSVFGKITVRF